MGNVPRPFKSQLSLCRKLAFDHGLDLRENLRVRTRVVQRVQSGRSDQTEILGVWTA
jgi:hypothetical protein